MVGLIKSRQFAKRANYWDRNNLKVTYSERFYLVKGDKKKRRAIQKKFKKIKSDFIDAIKSLENFKERPVQTKFNDILTLENKLEELKDEYIEAYGALIEEEIEQDPATIKPVKHAKIIS